VDHLLLGDGWKLEQAQSAVTRGSRRRILLGSNSPDVDDGSHSAMGKDCVALSPRDPLYAGQPDGFPNNTFLVGKYQDLLAGAGRQLFNVNLRRH